MTHLQLQLLPGKKKETLTAEANNKSISLRVLLLKQTTHLQTNKEKEVEQKQLKGRDKQMENPTQKTEFCFVQRIVCICQTFSNN